jgi:hypothetical protein
MASLNSEPEGNDFSSDGEAFQWPEMDMIENIIQDIKLYVQENKTGAHISIDIDFRTMTHNNQPVVQEKYSIGATSVNPTEENKTEETKVLHDIISDEMQESLPTEGSFGTVILPPDVANSSIQDQMKYIADKVREFQEHDTVGTDDNFLSFDHLKDWKRDNGKQ